MRCHVNRLQIGGPNNWLLTMTGPTGTVTARLYWTRQPGDQNLDAVRNRAGHTRLLCLRYPDPRNAARDIELFGVPQLGRKASGVDGPTGYPPAEDWPLNDAYGNERADLDEFGIGILQPSRAWDYWLLKKGYQRNMWKMGLEIDGYNAGVGLLT